MAANYYRFQLLTGCRGVEILGEKKYDYEPIRVQDVNLETGRILLIDTKNRSNHLLLLSREALAIAKEACEGREPEEPLFPIADARKTLAWINKQAGTIVQGHYSCAAHPHQSPVRICAPVISFRVATMPRIASAHGDHFVA